MFKKLLVTGGAGFIGSHLVDKLIEKRHQVIVLDNLSLGKKENVNPKAKFENVDICRFEKIKPLFEGVDCVFHLAAIPRMPISIKQPVLTSDVNIMGTVNVFTAAKDAGAKRIIYASSSSVYGNQKELPFRESLQPNPLSPYGLQKLIGEQFAQVFTAIYNIPIISLRYFCVFGPRASLESDYSMVIGKFLKLQSQGKPLTVYGDGEQTRGFCYVEDTVRANLLAAESDNLKGGEIINVGGEKSISVNYLAGLIGGEKTFLPPRPGDPLHTKADISLAKELLGWQPKVSFEQGVELTKKWFENL